jgi:tol-pal system protein YbgF
MSRGNGMTRDGLTGCLCLVACALLSALAACDTTKPEEQPAYRKAVAVEERVVKVENQTDALVSLSAEVEGLKLLLRQQTGQLEELRHQVQTVSSENRAIATDNDTRLKALEDRFKTWEAKAADTASNSETKPQTKPAAKLSDKDAYENARELFKQKDFSGCARAFAQFLQIYPDSSLVDNALFWEGACQYSDAHLGDAMTVLTRLLRDHPESRKVPDALLVIARTEIDLKRPKEAKDTLKRLIRDYPDAPAVVEAKARLKSLETSH